MSALRAVQQTTYKNPPHPLKRFPGNVYNHLPTQGGVFEFVSDNLALQDCPQSVAAVDYIESAVFEILLKDRTTERNIIWGTNDYSFLGDMYKAESEIIFLMITDYNSDIIQARAAKEQSQQAHRTKDKAEVFTPSWICNEQNNLIDEQWFGRKGVFNAQLNKAWKTNTDKITFTEKKKTWQKYVDDRRLEITCGEAPYLVSRYDTVTGEAIDIENRIGFLDRKLRVVNENTTEFDEWFKWTERAYHSIYGYEYQGDSLLIARKNLLFTFIDNLQYKFNRMPTTRELKKNCHYYFVEHLANGRTY
jgi:hypothetical protein